MPIDPNTIRWDSGPDVAPRSAPQAPPLRQIVPPQPKQPSPQTPEQARSDVLSNMLTEEKLADAQREREEAAKTDAQRDAGIQDTVHQMRGVIDAATKARDLSQKGWFATGFGARTARDIGGTTASDVKALLNTIGANTAFDRLQKMRDESKTGGALGQVSEIELQLLRDSIASIDQSQSDAQFQENMDRVIKSYQRVIDRLEGKSPDQTEQAGNERRDAPPPTIGADQGAQPPAAASSQPAPPDGTPGEPGFSPPSFSAPPDQRELAGDLKTVELPNRSEIEQGYLGLLEKNTPPAQIVGWLKKQGVTDPRVLRDAIEQAKFRRANPDVPLRSYDVSGLGQHNEPTSAFEQAATAAAGNPVGTYAINAANFLTGNTLDNLTSDPEAARTAMDVANETNPTAATLGSVSGGVLGALTGEAGLARGFGMAPGLARGVAADMGMGAANAAGAADNGDRLAAAGKGGLAAAAGSLAGTGAIAGARRALSPTGGRLGRLYEEGVRPTPGQRLSNAGGGKGLAGTLGRIASTTEEALSSVPIVGAGIRGAREDARRQFQRGAFNQSLREIGVKLPDSVEVGPAAHKFTQRAFNRVYDEARSGMRLEMDVEAATDIAKLAPDIAVLGPQGQAKLKSIINNRVANRLKNGAADGENYKLIVSGLDKQIAALRADPQQVELANVLTGFKEALESAARRHSDPDAVKLLDAADAGYAKLVRIEEASRRRGGEIGEFTPAQLDAAVQKASGGVRSKAYLRGDALMQDYAEQGRSLSDRLPNSGTADRLFAGGAVAGGAAVYEPTTLAILGLIGGLYAPGMRKATAGAFAPSVKNRKAIAAGLKRIERLTGAASAAGAVSAGSGGPGTSASQ